MQKAIASAADAVILNHRGHRRGAIEAARADHRPRRGAGARGPRSDRAGEPARHRVVSGRPCRRRPRTAHRRHAAEVQRAGRSRHARPSSRGPGDCVGYYGRWHRGRGDRHRVSPPRCSHLAPMREWPRGCSRSASAPRTFGRSGDQPAASRRLVSGAGGPRPRAGPGGRGRDRRSRHQHALADRGTRTGCDARRSPRLPMASPARS